MYKNLNPYSYAIFEIAKEENKLNEFVTLLFEQKDVLVQEEIRKFFSNDQINLKYKKDILSDIFNEKLIINWLMLIIKNRKFSSIGYILEKLFKISAKELNIQRGIIWTTEELDKEQFEKITEVFEKKQLSKIFFENKIDANLLGGIKVNIGDKVWDNSIKNKINILTNKLFERKEQ